PYSRSVVRPLCTLPLDNAASSSAALFRNSFAAFNSIALSRALRAISDSRSAFCASAHKSSGVGGAWLSIPLEPLAPADCPLSLSGLANVGSHQRVRSRALLDVGQTAFDMRIARRLRVVPSLRTVGVSMRKRLLLLALAVILAAAPAAHALEQVEPTAEQKTRC